ncbi:hypothetical protein FOA52_013140 [Chlamydomonas sp. UWO 241]|nr:hypothetical protein FOA52_013140 [Chlamydomonas sp. UWO 241]
MPAGDAEMGCRPDFGEVYTAGAVLGAGAFGQVRIGTDKATEQHVAIKSMLKVRGQLTREKTLAKIAREMGFMQRMQGQPCVVCMVGCFEDQDSVHMVTELCTGGDLRKYVETHGVLEEDTLAVVALQTLRFIRACHKNGIVYGDVKPANLVLPVPAPPAGEPFRIRAIDFGTSQPLADPTKRLKRRAGTFSFMAPEVFERNYGPPADMWSLGVMLYWLFSYRFPFWKTGSVPSSSGVEDIANAVSTFPVRFDYGPWLSISPEGLDFISRCMQRNEGSRLTTRQGLEHPWLVKAAATLEAIGGDGSATLGDSEDDLECEPCGDVSWDSPTALPLPVNTLLKDAPEEEAN